MGYPPNRINEEGITPVSRRIHIKYQEPGLWADQLMVETYPTNVQPEEVSNSILVKRERDAREVLQAVYHWSLVDLKTDKVRRLLPELYESLSSGMG